MQNRDSKYTGAVDTFMLFWYLRKQALEMEAL